MKGTQEVETRKFQSSPKVRVGKSSYKGYKGYHIKDMQDWIKPLDSG